MPEQGEIDEFYRKHYGFDPSTLTPEQRAHADKVLSTVAPAVNMPRILGTATGGWVNNPAYEQIRKEGGLDAKSARQLAIYNAWKNGEMPAQARALSDDEKRQHGITPEMLKSYEADEGKRRDEWLKKTAERFAPLIAGDPVEMEAEDMSVGGAKDKEGAASQPSSAPASQPTEQKSVKVAYRGEEARKRAGKGS